MKLAEKIAMLTIRDYGHDTAVDEVVSNIENIVAIAIPKNEKQKAAIENAVVKLMEEYHFDGPLREEDIEDKIYTRESMKDAELEKLKEIADEYSELAVRLQNELEANTKKLRGLQTQWL